MSAAYHDRGLSTTFDLSGSGTGTSLSGKARSKFKRLKKWNSRAKFEDKKDRNRATAFMEIRRLVSTLSLPSSVRDRACDLFSRAHEADLLPGGSIEQYAAAALYAACRVMEIPRTQTEIVSKSTTEKSDFRTAYRNINRELGLGVLPPEPVDFVPRILSEIDTDLASHERKEALSLVREAQDKNICQGRKPMAFAAGVIYHVASDRLVQTDLADISNSTVSPIRTAMKKTEEMIEDTEGVRDADTDEDETSDKVVSTDSGIDEHDMDNLRSEGQMQSFPDPDVTNTILVTSGPSAGECPLADGGTLYSHARWPSHSDDPINTAVDDKPTRMNENLTDPSMSDACVVCGQNGTDLLIQGEVYCRDCGYTLLYSLPTDDWEAFQTFDQRILEGEDPEDALEDIEGALYHPPFPGNHKLSRFSRLLVDRSEGYPSFNIFLTKPLQVAPVSPGSTVEVVATEDPHGIPTIDLYYLDEDEVSAARNSRKLLDMDSGSRVNVPREVAAKVLERHLSVSLERYDGTDPLLLWPQVMPDRIRLYAVAFQTEWEMMREESQMDQPPDDASASDSVQETAQKTEEQSDISTEYPSSIVVESAHDYNLSVSDLTETLGEARDRLGDQTLLDEYVRSSYEYKQMDVYIVPPSFWADDPANVLPADQQLRNAVQKVHYQTAKAIGEETDDLETELLSMDAIVIP
nr:transcription initiation factor IIB family protein [Halorhabdus tiamatea]